VDASDRNGPLLDCFEAGSVFPTRWFITHSAPINGDEKATLATLEKQKKSRCKENQKKHKSRLVRKMELVRMLEVQHTETGGLLR
jgi:hypothetical protein